MEERDKRTALLLSGAPDAVATISTTAAAPGTPPQPSLARKVHPCREAPSCSATVGLLRRLWLRALSQKCAGMTHGPATIPEVNSPSAGRHPQCLR